MKFFFPKQGPKCSNCPLYETGIPIMDRMPSEDFSGLTIIGEMAGRHEVKQRSVFVGPTGHLFKAICDAIAVPVDALHITNCIACGLPNGGRPEDGKVKDILECCRALLFANMRAMGTTVACATGAVPWESISGLKGINKYRGCVIPEQGKLQPWKMTATLHPAGLLQNESTRIGVENVRFDIEKAYNLATGRLFMWEPDVHDALDFEDLIDFLQTIVEEEWVVAEDVETDGIDAFSCNLTTIGLAASATKDDEPEAFSIPWLPAFPGWFTDPQWEEIIYWLVRLHQNPKQKIIFQNWTYDVPVLERHLELEILADIQDTLLLDHVCFPKLPHNLQNLASRYLPVEPWKDDFREQQAEIEKKIAKEYRSIDKAYQMDLDDEVEEQIYKGAVHIEKLDEQAVGELLWYNASDAAATWKIYWPLLQEAHELNTYKNYLEDIQLSQIALQWTKTGIKIDLEECRRLGAEYSIELDERKARLREMTDFPEPGGIREELEAWEDLAQSEQEELTDARKTCYMCGKTCGTTKKTLEHAKECEEGPHDLNYRVIEKCKANIKWARSRIKILKHTVTKANFNPGSAPQLRQVLAQRGLTPTKVTKKTLEVSTAKDSLWDLRDDVFIDELFRWRKLQKLYSTYIKNMESKLGPDGRIHPLWKIVATPSGRFGTQPAVQNWPSEMKRLMVAEEGNKIVGADYAALELRIIALLSGQEDLIEAFLTGADIHARHASWFFPTVWPEVDAEWQAAGETEKERDKKVPARKKLRGAGKPVTFGKNYRAGPMTLYENIREEREDVKTPAQHKQLLREVTMMSNVLDAKYKNIVDWADKMMQQANEEFWLRTELSGRIRKWPMGDVPPTEAANHPIQGMAADIMNRATFRLVERLKAEGLYENGIWIILQIHDALYLECYEELAEYAAKVLEECMYTEVTVTSCVTGKQHYMEFPAEATIADNVKDAA